MTIHYIYILLMPLSKATYIHIHLHIDTPTAQSTTQGDSRLLKSSEGEVYCLTR